MNSSELKGFITGLILGDGTIDKGVTKRAFRIKSINHDFIHYIGDCLRKTTNFKIEIKYHPASYRQGVYRRSYSELYIKAHPYFNKKYNHFYDDFRNRRVTKESLNWLNSRGLAAWYMSDGYIVRVGKTSGKIVDRRVELATDRYTKYDVDKIRKYLFEKYGFKTSRIHRGNGRYRIRISLLSAQDFFVMINPYVVPSMKYKLNLEYDYKPKWMTDDYYKLMLRLQSAEALTGKAEGQEIV